MSTEVEYVVRQDLSRQAETVVASDELKRAILDRMTPERAAYVRVQRIRLLVAAAAAVILVMVGAAVFRGESASERPQPAPPVPEVTHNSELLEKMPVGDAPDVLVLADRGVVTAPDGNKFSIGVDGPGLLGRSGKNILTFDERGYSVLRPGGPGENLTGPNPGLYAVSPDGTTFYRTGTLVDLATMRETGTMEMPTNVSGQYESYWTAAGIVFLTDNSAGFVPMQGVPVSVPALAPPAGVQFAWGSDRILVTPTSGCPYVAQLLPSGQLTTVRERCDGDLLSLSRDGSTGLLGQRNSSAAPPGIDKVTGLLNIDTGVVTELPWLAALDEFSSDNSWGDDLFSFTWEDGNAVLLAYYVERDDLPSGRRGTVRIVRCTLASELCEVAPGSINPLLYRATIFSQGIGE